MDTSKREVAVAMLVKGRRDFIEWKGPMGKAGIERLARKIKKEAVGKILCCYEAGPNGYDLQRRLKALGIECVVVAPSLTPRKPGERIKTDRRDARKLAEYLRAGQLTEVGAPTEAEEGVRDLCRAREDAVEDRARGRHRLAKMLDRRGFLYDKGKKSWTKKHVEWIRRLEFPDGNLRVVAEDALLALDVLEARIADFEKRMEAVSKEEPYLEVVGALCCFRGIRLVTAMTVVAEIFRFGRFPSPRKLMAYLGLVPSEYSTGGKEKRGGITKAGNSHVRRVLVEASHHYRHRPFVSKELGQRRSGQPAWAVAIADKAMKRLHARYWRLILTGRKSVSETVTAVARELAGFVWAVAMAAERGRAAR